MGGQGQEFIIYAMRQRARASVYGSTRLSMDPLGYRRVDAHLL